MFPWLVVWVVTAICFTVFAAVSTVSLKTNKVIDFVRAVSYIAALYCWAAASDAGETFWPFLGLIGTFLLFGSCTYIYLRRRSRQEKSLQDQQESINQ